MQPTCRICRVELVGDVYPAFLKRQRSGICKDCRNNKRNEDYQNNIEDRRRANRRRNRRYILRLKLKVIGHYSNGTMECANPFGKHKEPYTDIRATSIDHIKGGGRKHRKGIGSGFYRWLIKHNYPKGYQVLCMSCQYIKRWENFEFASYIHDELL